MISPFLPFLIRRLAGIEMVLLGLTAQHFFLGSHFEPLGDGFSGLEFRHDNRDRG